MGQRTMVGTFLLADFSCDARLSNLLFGIVVIGADTMYSRNVKNSFLWRISLFTNRLTSLSLLADAVSQSRRW